MLDFILANLGTIVVALILIAVVVIAIRSIVKKRKNGGSACGCDCGNCPHSSGCHKE